DAYMSRLPVPMRQRIGPEADLIVIPLSVAILRPVERWRSRVTREGVNGRIADLQRHIPMRLARQPHRRQLFIRIPRRTIRLFWQPGVGPVLPEEVLQSP